MIGNCDSGISDYKGRKQLYFRGGHSVSTKHLITVIGKADQVAQFWLMVTQYDAAVISIYLPRARGRLPETKTQIYDRLRTIGFARKLCVLPANDRWWQLCLGYANLPKYTSYSCKKISKILQKSPHRFKYLPLLNEQTS